MNKQKGGILIDSKDDEAFSHFIQNSTFSFLSNGTFGLTVKANLKPGVESKYRHIESSTRYDYGDEVRTIIIKLGFIHDASKGERASIVRISQVNNFETVELQTFKNEVNIQTDIFFKTFNYMQPLCPSIIYAEIIKDFSEKINILNLLRKAENLPFPVENNIIFNDNVSIIVMEMIHNSIPLSNYIYEINQNINKLKKYIKDIQKENNDDNLQQINIAMNNINGEKRKKEIVENISRYALLKLAIDTGYNHSDFHKGNILIQYDDTYFKNINKSPILLDFGRTTKLNLDILNSIKQKVEQKNYIGALTELCKPFNSELQHTKFENASYFDWVCGDYEGLNGDIKKRLPDTVNIRIDELFKLRELAIDENIQKMNKLHDSEPSKYPLLPLSNSIKNNLYNGMIGGKRKIKRKRKTKKNKFYRRNKSNRKYKYKK